METRTLGRTGLQVPVVGFGSMTIGGIFGPVDDAVSIQALHAAIDAGMRFIDTSDAYGAGHSERVIGRFLRERPDRDQIIICTKGGNNMVTGARNFTPEYIRGCVEGSLQRLGIEAIDLYLLHNPSVQNLKAGDSFELLEKYKAEGKIKHWGVSLNTLEECELAVADGRPAVLQMEYNLLDQEAEGVFAKAKAAGVGVISRVPLKRGLLSGRIDEQTQFVEGDRRRNILAPDKLPAMVARVKRIAEVVADYGRPLAEVAVRFCVSNPDVSLTIPGIRTPEQARANAAASEPLPADVLQKLRRID
ncbi:MAG: aldo/keto reductase [Candidatus Tectomicrobia bacterium]|jgi:aryl-alcohol dehydrogenase-like predicted oxidoreductase|nr:aldo/keto reductase [Candidatus Tectomicrobia bacterium]